MDWDTFLQVWANRYGFTPEQREAFVARFTQENQSKSDIQIYQSLNLGEAAFKKRMADVYSKLARDYILLERATKGKRELLQTILQAAFDAQTNNVQTRPAAVADQSGEAVAEIPGYPTVRSLLEQARTTVATHTSQAFYNGTLPQWADIAAGYDVERDRLTDLQDFVESRAALGGALPIALVLGRSGDGKSTLLMRLAAELNDRGDRVLWHEPNQRNQVALDLTALATLKTDRRVVVIIDDAHALDLEGLEQQVRSLHRDSAGLLLVLGVRRELWLGGRQLPQSIAQIQRFEIDRVSDAEIDRFLAAYERAGELGKLVNLSPAARAAKFRQGADRQLLVMLLEAKYNESLTSYVQKTLNDLADRFSPKVVQACQLVAALHTFDLGFPARLLETILDVDELETDILAKTDGWLISEGYGRLIQTRHPVIATVIFQGDRANYRRLSQFIEAELQQTPDYFLTPRLMHNLRVRTKTKALDLPVEPLRDVFRQAVNCFPIRRFVYNIWAVMENDCKNYDQARKLFRKATEADPNNAASWQAWAVMESGLKNHAEARRLFQQATEVDRNNAPAWGGWAIMERNAGNYDKARELFDRTLKLEPYNAKSWRTWAAMERNLGNHDEARRLSDKAAQLEAARQPAPRSGPAHPPPRRRNP